jgi:hypothetical protein
MGTNMNKEEIEELAIQIGMSTESTGYSAPHGIMNPGLYFGAKMALEKANAIIETLELQLFEAQMGEDL